MFRNQKILHENQQNLQQTEIIFVFLSKSPCGSKIFFIKNIDRRENEAKQKKIPFYRNIQKQKRVGSKISFPLLVSNLQQKII